MKFFFLYVLVLFAFSSGLNQLLWYSSCCHYENYSHPLVLGIMLIWKKRNVQKCHPIILKAKMHQPIIMLALYGDDLQSILYKLQLTDNGNCKALGQIKFVIFSLFETTQTLFWAVFGLVDLDSFELDGIKIFTRFWGMLMFGTYSVINIVVLLNLLIAMMNHSYQLISVRHISMQTNYLSFYVFTDTKSQSREKNRFSFHTGTCRR